MFKSIISNQYIKKCMSKNSFHLDATDFFIPLTNQNQINYYRLFNEIYLICKDKLFIDVMNEMILYNPQKLE